MAFYQWEVFPKQPWPRGFGLRYVERVHVDRDLDQLELELEGRACTPAADLRPRDVLRRVFDRSRLSQHDFARWALGICEWTFTRYLAGDRMPAARRNLVSRLESVICHGEFLVITVRTGALVERMRRGSRARDRSERSGR